jgi:PAS domain-containing protein
MKVVCSYCRSLIREKEPMGDATVSHSICPACFEHYAPQWEGLSTGAFLDRFDAPIAVVDLDIKVLAINQRLAKRLGITDREAAGLMGGELLECDYARLPEGCGRTVHCKACTVRGVVTNTLATGEPQHAVPARIEVNSKALALELSTYLADGLVYLLIEPARHG